MDTNTLSPEMINQMAAPAEAKFIPPTVGPGPSGGDVYYDWLRQQQEG
jgi:hypothetical protein